MGTLIAWHYRTPMFLKLADHTYVTCSNGAARWKCWGGDTGGTALRQGDGSTIRADVIAEPDERAGITCYLINGVCHQAANRILSPAAITVRGARGYYVSEALYGTYGRPRGFLGTCRAPFDHHAGVTGDLKVCEHKVASLSAQELDSARRLAGEDPDAAEYQRYLGRVNDLYRQADIRALAEDPDQSMRFQLELFKTLVEYKLSPAFLESKAGDRLLEIRAVVEDERRPIETVLERESIPVDDFVQSYNRLAASFQHRVAETLSEADYTRLLELGRDDTVELGDPEAARAAYGGQT